MIAPKGNPIFSLTASWLADPPTILFAFLDNLDNLPLNESKRILPLCRKYLWNGNGALAAWVSEYVEGFPDRQQLRLVFGA